MMGEAFNMRIGTRNLTLAKATAEAVDRGTRLKRWWLCQKETTGSTQIERTTFALALWLVSTRREGYLMGMTYWQMSSHQRMWCNLIFLIRSIRKKDQRYAKRQTRYCQIMGKWQVPIFGYSSIPLYDHMNEKCPSLAPDFYRPSDC